MVFSTQKCHIVDNDNAVYVTTYLVLESRKVVLVLDILQLLQVENVVASLYENNGLTSLTFVVKLWKLHV